MQEEQYQQHPARNLVNQLLELEKHDAFSDPSLSTSQDFGPSRDSIFAIARAIGAYFEETPAVLAASGINNLTGALQGTYNGLLAFTSDRTVSRVPAALAQIEQLIPYLSSFIPRTLANKSGLTSKVIAGLQNAAQESIVQVTAQKDALVKQLATLKEKNSEQERKLEALAETISTQKADALAVVAQVQKEFAETEQKRITDFASNIAAFQQEFQKFSADKEKLTLTLIQNIEKSRDDAKDLLQVVGAITLTGNYKKVAESEEKQANNWRYVTTAFFGVGVLLALASVGFAFYIRWKHPNLPVSDVYIDLLMRLLTAIAITSPAWYFAKESARHRTNSDRAKQRETELTSLGPFIELLPEETRNEIRATLTPRYFGNDVEAHQAGNVFSAIDTTAIAGKVIDAIPKSSK
jgi:hypothetical protein